MNEEIIAFIRTQREQLAADMAWQDGYAPNDTAPYSAIDGGRDMLQKLCEHFGLGWEVDKV